MPQSGPTTRRHFSSLGECVEFLEESAPATGGEVPAYLFRGEPGIYHTTVPSCLRTLRPLPSMDVRDVLIEIEGDFLGEFEEEFGAGTEGFLQHYGVPTQYVEFTSSPTVAAAFACRHPADQAGLIGVLETAVARGKASILDLSHHPLAGRAGRQQAWAVSCTGGSTPDYKDPGCCGRIGLRWYSFGRGEGDAAYLRDVDALTETRSDAVAEWMRTRVRSQRSRERRGSGVDQVLCMIEARLA